MLPAAVSSAAISSGSTRPDADPSLDIRDRPVAAGAHLGNDLRHLLPHLAESRLEGTDLPREATRVIARPLVALDPHPEPPFARRSRSTRSSSSGARSLWE